MPECDDNNNTSLFQKINDLSANLVNSSGAMFKCVEPAFLSEIEARVLRSDRPISVSETEEISALGHQGLWMNKQEIINWKDELPINNYELNEDFHPEIFHKKFENDLVYVQELAVRYLRPPKAPTPGDIIIKHETSILPPPAPPLVIRQQPARACTPEPLVVREKPPAVPPLIGQKIITISSKKLPPPPRKVVIERLPQIPAKPQAVISERWLPYIQPKRRVIYQAPPPDPVYCKPKNVIVQWNVPDVVIKQEVKFLGVVNANPTEYAERYGDSLKSVDEFPLVCRKIPVQEGYTLAADINNKQYYELEGDIQALKLIDLEAEGLGMYKKYAEETAPKKRHSSVSSGSGQGSLSDSTVSLNSILDAAQTYLYSSGSEKSINDTKSNMASTFTSRPSKSALKSESSGQIEKKTRIVESNNQDFFYSTESPLASPHSISIASHASGELDAEDLKRIQI